MKIRHLSPRAFVNFAILTCAVIIATGCKSAESRVVGKWNGPNGVSVTFKEDKTFSQAGMMPVTGKWTVADKKVTVNVETVNGKSPDDLIKQLKSMGAPADTIKKAQDELKKGMDMTLSDDGKTMTLKAPSGQSGTLTKDEAK